MSDVEDEALIEQLAALSHEQWSGWMRYLFEHCSLIPESFAIRWKRQMKATYLELPESEKESDRVEARKVFATISAALSAKQSEIERLRQGLWDCAGYAGADLDGDETPRSLASDIVAFAVGAVKEHCEGYDELLDELKLDGDQREAGLKEAAEVAQHSGCSTCGEVIAAAIRSKILCVR